MGTCLPGSHPCSAPSVCTTATCDEPTDTCGYTVNEDYCYIDGECREESDDDPSNQCRWCDPETSVGRWSDKPEGASCDDGDPCNEGDVCDGAGNCVGSELFPVKDGAFQTTTEWAVSGSALVDTTAPGHDESGEGQFPEDAVCALDEISQNITMPAIEDCGPARLAVWASSLPPFGMAEPLAGNVNGNWLLLVDWITMEWVEDSTCLGEAAYGDSYDLIFSPAFRPRTCDSVPPFADGIRIDNVSIELDSTCPDVGEIINGNLESGDGFGWDTYSWGGATAEADAAGVGVGGSYGARISCDVGCSEASMAAPMSVPMPATMADPALSFQANLSAGESAEFKIRNVLQMNLAGTGAFEEVRMCLPHYMAGAAYDLYFYVDCWGTCGAPMPPRTLVTDDFTVIDDSTCLFSSGMLDPGFEMSVMDSLRYGWVLEVNETSFGGNPVAEIDTNPADAHSGSASLHLSIDQHCDSAHAKQSVEIPQPSGANGPAVVLWYKYPSPSDSILDIAVSAFTTWERIAERSASGSNAYTREVLCLPQNMAGRPALLEINLNSFGSCAVFFPSPEEAWLDDLEVTTDPSCPVT